MKVILRKETMRERITKAIREAGKPSDVTDVILDEQEWLEYIQELKGESGPRREHPDRVREIERRGQDLWQHDNYCIRIRYEGQAMRCVGWQP